MEPLSPQIRFSALLAANPWWQPPFQVDPGIARRTPRPFLNNLVETLFAAPGVWLQGPRGVGKTLLIHQAVAQFLGQGLPPGNICYLPADHPALAGFGPSEVLDFWTTCLPEFQSREVPRFLLVDEPYTHLEDWKKLALTGAPDQAGLVVLICSSVVAAPTEELEATGAPIPRLFLPPLTFPEYVAQRQDNPFGQGFPDQLLTLTPALIQDLDRFYAGYLRFSGFSGPAASPFHAKAISQILPTGPQSELLTVGSERELREMLLILAHVNGTKVAPEELIQATGLAKNTSRKYVAALEDAHLIRIIHRISKWGGRMQRARNFRSYLVHPCLRAVLLGQSQADGEEQLQLAINGLLVQLPPSRAGLVEHPWGAGLGLVHVNPERKVSWAMEIGYADEDLDPEPLAHFCRIHHLRAALMTTRTRFEKVRVNGVLIHFIPLAIQAYVLGYRLAWRQHLKITESSGEV